MHLIASLILCFAEIYGGGGGGGGYEFTLMIGVNSSSFKCVDATCQIDKIILRKGFSSSIVLQNKICSIKQICFK